MNGIVGNPGTKPMQKTITDPIKTGVELEKRCLANSAPIFISDPDLETRRPAAAEIRSAGIWVTRPSPTVSSV